MRPAPAHPGGHHRGGPFPTLALSTLLAVVLAVVPAGCSVLDPTFLADPATDGTGDGSQPPVVVQLDFDGNATLGSATLRGHVEDYMLDLSRDPSRESSVYDAALEIEDLYRSRGHPITTVTYTYAPVAADQPRPERVLVVLHVTEGPLVSARMQLRGNHAYPAGELLALWRHQRSGVFGLGTEVFVEAEVRAFVDELRTFYRAHARLDAVVQSPVIELDLAAATAAITVTVEEGHVHTIGTVTLDATLLAALGTTPPPSPAGRPYTDGELQTYRTRLRNALRNLGHPDPRITIAAAPIADAPFTVELKVDGDPGPIATIDTITVAGNERTLDGTILGRLPVTTGDRYDGSRIDQALRRLYGTGLFRKVEVREVPLDGDPQRLALGVQVEENDARTIELLGGYGSYEGVRGALRLEDRNLFGTGRGIAFDNRLSLKGYATGLTVTDPDFLSSQTTLSVSGEYFRREEPSFTDNAVGGTMALSRPLTQHLTTRVGYTYRQRTDPRALTALPEDQFVDFVEGRVFVELQHDRRDSLLFPRAGHAEYLSFERLSPTFGANVDLDRLIFRAARHIGLFGDLRMALRAEHSVLWPHEGSARVPLQERWFLGGEATVRSFRESQLGPKDLTDQPTGGEYRNLFAVELRLPLSTTVETALFVDAGNVGSEVQDAGFDDLSYGIGTGLRWLLPIGPVRVDAAWNPDPNLGERSWAAHLSVGYPF